MVASLGEIPHAPLLCGVSSLDTHVFFDVGFVRCEKPSIMSSAGASAGTCGRGPVEWSSTQGLLVPTRRLQSCIRPVQFGYIIEYPCGCGMTPCRASPGGSVVWLLPRFEAVRSTPLASVTVSSPFLFQCGTVSGHVRTVALGLRTSWLGVETSCSSVVNGHWVLLFFPCCAL